MAGNGIAPIRMVLTEKDVRKAIRSAAPQFDVESLAEGESFLSAGLDSLDHAMILLRLYERHGLNVPDEDVMQCTSIEGIIEYASKHP
jgi:acyl carrier protein